MAFPSLGSVRTRHRPPHVAARVDVSPGQLQRIACLVVSVALVLVTSASGQAQLLNGHLVVVGHENACTTGPTGGTDSYACTLAATPSSGFAYVTGACYQFTADVANTGAASLNLHSTGATPIKKVVGGITTDLADNDIRAGHIVKVCYDGTNLQCQNCDGNSASTATSTSVDSEVALFAGTGGTTLKRATGTGLARLASGVQSAAELSGDVTTAGSNAATVAKVNGVTYSASPSTDAVPVVTAANTATYKALPDCDDAAGNHLNYDTTTHAFSCGTTSSGGGGGTPFAAAMTAAMATLAFGGL